MFNQNTIDMKKILLTGAAAVMISFCAISQDQPEQPDNNQYRQQQQDRANDAADDVQRGVDRAQQETEQAQDNIQRESNEFRQDVDRAGDRLEEATDEAGQNADRSLDNMNREFESAVTGEERPEAPDLTVVEGKEGPNSEVVFEYEGEYFYVDRNSKEVIKAERSELQDAKHDLIIHENGNDENSEASPTEAEPQ